METLRDLRRRLRDAIKRGDWETVARVRQLLVIHAHEHADRQQLQAFLEPHAVKLESSTANGDSRKTEAILALLLIALLRWFETRIYAFTQQTADDIAGDYFEQLTPSQISAALELPVTKTKELIPPAVELPPTPSEAEADQIDRKDLFLLASPLLLAGAAAGISARELLFRGVNNRAKISVRAESARETAHWRTTVRYYAERAAAKVKAAIGKEATLASKAVRDAFGLLRAGGLLGTVTTQLRHEKLRVIGDTRSELGTSMATYVGTSIHSRFLPTTDPVHASNDGRRFYIDDRPTADGAWSERLIAPYRVNCVCFNLPIFAETDAPEHGAPFEIRWNRSKSFVIRDPAAFRTWFDAQQPAVRRKIVGDERYFAALSTGTGSPDFADFFDKHGKQLPTRRLLDQSQAERLIAREAVNEAINRRRETYARGYQRFADEFVADFQAEAAYRRRLEQLLAGL